MNSFTCPFSVYTYLDPTELRGRFGETEKEYRIAGSRLAAHPLEVEAA